MSILISVISGALLCLCYPTANLSWLAWFALVPLFISISAETSRGRVIFLTWLTGFVFFLGSLHFLTHVDFLGWLLLTFLESFFWIILGILFFETRRFSSGVLRIFWIALSFAIVELIRTEIPVLGFGLNLLGASQAFHPAMIQIASIGGTYLLSFFIVSVNASFGEVLSNAYHVSSTTRLRIARGAMYAVLPLLLILALLIWGRERLGQVDKQIFPSVRIAVIQPNIPQAVKWVPMAKKEVLEILENLSKIAALHEPQLIFWPEAAFPGYLNADLDAEQVFRLVREMKIPLLIGAPWAGSFNMSEKILEKIYNSAILVHPDGAGGERYDKIRLVPFGEYVPWKSFLSWLEPMAYTLGVSDFTAGQLHKVFFWEQPFPFSVLICFEDVFPDLARESVKAGAKFLAVITNDAWFGKTSAPWQHLQSSIFRAVENGVPVLRSSNSGVSGFISAEGKVFNLVRDKNGESIFVSGELTFELPMVYHRTFYTRGGWRFPYVCIILLGILCFFRKKESADAK